MKSKTCQKVYHKTIPSFMSPIVTNQWNRRIWIGAETDWAIDYWSVFACVQSQHKWHHPPKTISWKKDPIFLVLFSHSSALGVLSIYVLKYNMIMRPTTLYPVNTDQCNITYTLNTAVKCLVSCFPEREHFRSLKWPAPECTHVNGNICLFLPARLEWECN